MHISGLSLQSFRNYTNQTFLFSNPLTIFLAPNASGKSNILEAIHLLSTGQSFRSGVVDDFIQIGKEFGRIKAKIQDETESQEIELLLTTGMVSGKRSAKKIFSLNEVRKQQRGVIGLLPTVAFIPEDLRLITGSPPRRRGFLDTLGSQLDPQYLSSLTQYEQTLRRRNKLLQQVREGETSETTLTYWNQSIIKHGEFIQHARRQIIDELNSTEFSHQFEIEYKISVMSEARLEQYRRAEIASGHTLVGPHKDDIIVKFQILNSKFQSFDKLRTSGQTGKQENRIENQESSIKETLGSEPQNTKILSPKTLNHEPNTTHLAPLSSHGSRGQQRMGVLWLKLGSFVLLEKKLQTKPILLLDDIFSELDAMNRKHVLDLTSKTQTIMTSAEEEILQIPELRGAEIVRL